MSTIVSVTEYPDEGFAIIEDTVGTYVAQKNTDKIIPVKDYGQDILQAYFGQKNPCALLQSRTAMLT